MSLFTVTLHKVRVGVVRKPVESSEIEIEALAPQELWDALDSKDGSSRIIREVIEVAEVANTTRSCPVCLSPREITANADVSFIPGESLELKEPEQVSVKCIADPTHEIHPEQVEVLLKELLSLT